MGRFRSGLMVTALSGILGTLAFAGCTADGTTGDPISEPLPEEPTTGLPPSSSSSGEVPKGDSGTPKKDGGKSEAGVDAGPPAPTPGDPCADLNKVVEKQCGACGKQSAVCLLGDAGAGYWSVYSACTGETAGGCIPGETVNEACGACGTRARTCSQFCSLSTPVCAGQPVGTPCPAGTFLLTNAGCPSSTTYQKRECGTTCGGSFDTNCTATPPTTFNIAPTVGTLSATIAVLGAGQVAPKISGFGCTNPSISTTLTTPYVYIQVKNPTAKAAVVTIYNGLAPGGAVIDTTLASYQSATAPTDDPGRKACDKLKTSGTTSLTGDFRFASLDGTSAVTIPANGTVMIHIAADKAYNALTPAESTGPIQLIARTDSFL